ncbi:MAG: LacI family transcriptional regulator [Lachnospiraceae bacterium]|nr:LacI family transcriptional regulator [Lachnospiraceae bacterium]
MASIRDVARIAGVSPSTVSRVMNGTANVEEDKRRKVLAAIQETGFKPNELARALFKQSSKIIGVIVPNIENPFFNELAKAVEEEAYINGYKILLCNSNNNTEKELMNIQMLNQMKADGIIILTYSDKTGQAIASCQLPVVVVDRQLTGSGQSAYVESDHYKGGKLAILHLLDCGCKNIVFLRGPLEVSSGQQRYQGYHEICNKYGIREQCIDCLYDYEDGLRAARELVEKYHHVDGVIASNDMIAIATYKILTREGYRIPDDVQMIGFDNIRFSWLFTPELTTVNQPIKKMGTLAVQIILNYAKGLPFQQENILDVSLVERQTTRRKE